MSKLSKVFKKKPKAAPVVAPVPVVAKAGPDLASETRKAGALRVRKNKGLGSMDEGAILRPGARSAKLLGE
jgi:hypothetical protein